MAWRRPGDEGGANGGKVSPPASGAAAKPPSGPPSDTAQPRARVQTIDGDLIAEAREVLVKCMRGEVRERTADVQRKAALDILDRGHLAHLSDEDLAAEVRRRATAAEAAAKARGAA